MPTSWCDDRVRCRTAGIPEAVAFRTKPALARVMLERALDAGVPAAWVTGDAVYGNDRALRQLLERRAGAIAAALPATAWQVLSVGQGSKGPREYRWAWTELTRLGGAPGQHALLVREAVTANTRGEYDRAYYLVFAPQALLPLTVPEVRHLLARLVLCPPLTPQFVFDWSYWRRRHQARAQTAHYRTRARRRQVQL